MNFLRNLKALFYEATLFLSYYFLFWPSGKRFLLKHMAKGTIGDDVDFDRDFRIFGSGSVHIGSCVKLTNTFINSVGADVIIEDCVFFGHRVMLLTGRHDYHLMGLARQNAYSGRPIHIKEGAWIGSGAIILGGVTVGRNAVVAAGSVVTKDVLPSTIVAGNPAKTLKTILNSV